MSDILGTLDRSNFQINLFYYMQRGEVRCIIFILWIVLITAVIMDLFFDRIFNEWILLSIMTGLSCAVWQGGAGGLIRAVLSMTIPVIILYPLFMIGGLGAGDIKLFSAVGCFLTIRGIIICVALSFLIGAAIALLKMLVERNFLQRMKYLLSYILDVFISREWKFYEQDIQEKKRKNEGRIHFAIPVLLGVIAYKGGMGW